MTTIAHETDTANTANTETEQVLARDAKRGMLLDNFQGELNVGAEIVAAEPTEDGAHVVILLRGGMVIDYPADEPLPLLDVADAKKAREEMQRRRARRQVVTGLRTLADLIERDPTLLPDGEISVHNHGMTTLADVEAAAKALGVETRDAHGRRSMKWAFGGSEYWPAVGLYLDAPLPKDDDETAPAVKS